MIQSAIPNQLNYAVDAVVTTRAVVEGSCCCLSSVTSLLSVVAAVAAVAVDPVVGRRPSTLAMTDWLKNPINLLGIFALLTPTAQGTCQCSSSDSAEVQLSGACWRQVRPAARMNTSWGIRAFRAPVEL